MYVLRIEANRSDSVFGESEDSGNSTFCRFVFLTAPNYRATDALYTLPIIVLKKVSFYIRS